VASCPRHKTAAGLPPAGLSALLFIKYEVTLSLMFPAFIEHVRNMFFLVRST